MIYALDLTDAEGAQRIRKLALQVERSFPGVLVFNLHPQNVGVSPDLHREVIQLANRPGWIALGLESYLHWLKRLRGLRVQIQDPRHVRLECGDGGDVRNLVLRFPSRGGWQRREVAPWSGHLSVATEEA